MAVTINLKQIFSTDSQSELASKLNFNYNQLLTLGIGTPGPIGPVGTAGVAGPIGPVGTTGAAGYQIYGQSTSGGTPSGTIPTGIRVGDVLISTDSIWQKTGSTTWNNLTNFNDLVTAALGVSISPYSLLSPGSRIVKPKVSAGIDLTNSAGSGDPNYSVPGLPTNYQTILYNFNELNTYSVKISGGSIVVTSNSSSSISFNSATAVDTVNNRITIGTNTYANGDYVIYSNEGGTTITGLTNYTGYFIYKYSSTIIQLCNTYVDAIAGTTFVNLTSAGVGTQKLISATPDPDNVFPQTSNLSLYSFFNSTGDLAQQFASSAKGYRSQIELGSVDTLPTQYTTGAGPYSFVISPSFENLKIRKYRLAGPGGWAVDNPGNYYLRAEYDLSSAGSSTPTAFSPRRNSEQIWKINKAESTANAGRVFEMKLTNSNILTANEPSAGFTIDGLFFKKNPSVTDVNAYYLGIGFSPSDSTRAMFAASSLITTFQFNGVSIELKNGSALTQITNTGIGASGYYSVVSTSGNISISTQVLSGTSGNITISTANTSGTGGNVQIQTGTSGSIGLNNAIKVKGDRLSQGLPFPTSSVLSTDPNTLDNYTEGILGSDSTNAGRLNILRVTTAGGATAFMDASTYSGFVTYSRYYYTRIGRQVTINGVIVVNCNNWPSGAGYTFRNLTLSLPYIASYDNNYLNLAVYDLTTMPSDPEYFGYSPGGSGPYTRNHYIGFGTTITRTARATLLVYSPTNVSTSASVVPTLTTAVPKWQYIDSSIRQYDSGSSTTGFSTGLVIAFNGSYFTTAS